MSDWRLEHLETQPYLVGMAFRRAKYRPYRPGWDHDHCVACWAKFVEYDDPAEPIQHEGYATTEEFVRGAEYDWVCLTCFADFKDQMKWIEA
ncbi:MAG: hypothetical protein BroJett013_10390 [Alphaproteobacteria bacterium]|nr:MAG: hypothetical protein BroJett013_10390 [Alphaproteobacteria bacterium]